MSFNDMPIDLARQARALRIGAVELRRRQHDQRRTGGKLCIQLPQQAAGGVWRVRRGSLQLRESRCQPMPPRIRRQCLIRDGRRGDAGHDRDEGPAVFHAMQGRARQPQGEHGQQQQAQREQQAFVETQAAARARLGAQPAQCGEVERSLLVAPRKVDQQRQQQCRQRG